MPNFEQYILFLSQIPFVLLLLAAFLATFVENIFPPAPSDMLAVAIAAVAGIKKDSVLLIILAAVLGSILGFYIMFILGRKFEHKIIDANKFQFISRNALSKVDNLFHKWGFWLVVVNRFMSGTRAVISFFAGASNLPTLKTTVLSGVSSLLWYGILCGVGGYFGKDWYIFYGYVELYQNVVIVIVAVLIILAALVFVFSKFFRQKKTHIS